MTIQDHDLIAYFTLKKPSKVLRGIAYFGLKLSDTLSVLSLRHSLRRHPRGTPQYGGYCAWAVGHRYTANVDPTQREIIDEKNYLNDRAMVTRYE